MKVVIALFVFLISNFAGYTQHPVEQKQRFYFDWKFFRRYTDATDKKVSIYFQGVYTNSEVF